MCGRYTIHTSLQVIADLFEVDNRVDFVPRYNVAPSQDVPVIRLDADNRRELSMMRWGLVPFWAKDVKIGYKLINARSESLSEKPAFRQAYKRRRCLIVADGFYEWKKLGATKQPYLIGLKDQAPFAFAGLWEHWKSQDAETEITSCTIITTNANEYVADLHDRMPVILPAPSYGQWLDPQFKDEEALGKMMKPYDASLMTAFAVSTQVNSPRKDDPLCIRPLLNL